MATESTSMSCDITTEAMTALQRFNALCNRCCEDDSAPCVALVNQDEQCVVPMILDIHNAVNSLLSGGVGTCLEMTADPSYTLPELPTCMTGAFMTSLNDCIEHITCEDEEEPPPICDLSLDSSGGDEGYDQTFGAGNGGYSIIITYETYYQEDQIILYSQTGTILFDSGCIGTQGERDATVVVPVGTTSIRVRVIPNCNGGSGTAWYLSIRCQ